MKALAKATIRELYAAAALIGSAEDRERAEVHARRSESAKGINAMVSCAEYEPGIIIDAAGLDRENYLLNAFNGTIELNTGQVRPHRREDFITKVVHFDYDPTAQCPVFLNFLARIMGRKPNGLAHENDAAERLISYLQKCFGYALTADVSEKAVFCFHGSGRNGKTTLLEIIRYVIKEYSAQILVDNLIPHTTRESSASLADFADLVGARFVTTSEAEEGQRLALGKLKYLTQGTGEIKSCRKYENPVQFVATHKLFIDTNYKPVIRGADTAAFDRLKLVPFNIRIPEEEIDKSLLEKLKREGPGILRWLVEGCERWFKEGLGDPPEIKDATDAWKTESDHVLIFVEAECVLARDLGREPKNVWVGATQLWDRYTKWCEAHGQGALPKPKFEDRLSEFGCSRAKENNGTVRSWRGIGLRSSESIPEQGNSFTQSGTFPGGPEDL